MIGKDPWMSAELTAAEEWKRHWGVVLASCVGFSLLSVMPGSLSFFMAPLGAQFGWSRTLLSSGYTCATIVTTLVAPFFGIVIDRYGSRRSALLGSLLVALAIAAFALSNGSASQWLALWTVYGVAAVFTMATVWTTAVAGLFKAGQGLALGLTLCGSAAAHIILPPVVNLLISEFGWRRAYVFLGLGWGGATFLLCWLFLFDAHAQVVGERGKGIVTKRALNGRPAFTGLSIAEAWQDTALWRIAVSTVIIMSLTIGLEIHQITILVEAGVSRGHAALLASMAGFAAIGGKLLTGVLLDRFAPNWVGGLTLAATALAFGLLVDGVHTPVLIALAMFVNGYAQGTNFQISGYLTAQYGGMLNYGKIFGFMTSLISLGSGLGPIFAGYVYDVSGGYTFFLIAGSAGCIIAGCLLFTLPKYPKFEEHIVEQNRFAPR
jgi:MFS family permease